MRHRDASFSIHRINSSMQSVSQWLCNQTEESSHSLHRWSSESGVGYFAISPAGSSENFGHCSAFFATRPRSTFATMRVMDEITTFATID
jgi:hypothetical protein